MDGHQSHAGLFRECFEAWWRGRRWEHSADRLGERSDDLVDLVEALFEGEALKEIRKKTLF